MLGSHPRSTRKPWSWSRVVYVPRPVVDEIGASHVRPAHTCPFLSASTSRPIKPRRPATSLLESCSAHGFSSDVSNATCTRRLVFRSKWQRANVTCRTHDVPKRCNRLVAYSASQLQPILTARSSQLPTTQAALCVASHQASKRWNCAGLEAMSLLLRFGTLCVQQVVFA